MDQKKLKLILMIGSAFFGVVGILLIVLGIFLDIDKVSRAFAIISAVFSLCIGAEGGWYLLLMKDERQNFFLFNYQTKRNIPVQKLTFQIVNGRMTRYISGFAASEGKIWTERVLDNPNIEMNEVFKPAVAYKLLFDLAEYDTDPAWKCFEVATNDTVEFICSALEMNNDKELAATLMQAKESKPINMKFVRDYLVKNKKYIQKKLFVYVYDNIQSF